MWKAKAAWKTYSQEPTDSEQYLHRMNHWYDVLARTYGAFMLICPPYKRWLTSVLPFMRGRTVLEVSFGTGYLMHHYARTYEAYGIDYNEHMVKVTRKRLRGAVPTDHLLQGDVARLPYADAAFDTVISTMAFTGYPDGERALDELVRVIKPGGVLLIVDVDYPADGNLCGFAIVKVGAWIGDIIRDIGALLERRAVAYTCETIGGCGSVKCWVVTKPLVSESHPSGRF